MQSHSLQTQGTVCEAYVEQLQQLLFLSVYIFYHFMHKFVFVYYYYYYYYRDGRRMELVCDHAGWRALNNMYCDGHARNNVLSIHISSSLLNIM